MDLSSGLDEILQVSPKEEITEVDKLAVSLILDVDDTPSVLSSANGLSVNDHIALRSNDSKGDHGADDFVVLQLILVKLVGIERIETNVVIDEFGTDSRPEALPLLNRQTVALGNDRDDIDDFAQFLHDDDIDRSQRVTSRVDEEESAVNASVDDILVTHSGELFAEVGGMLVLDVFNDWVPAVLVVDLVSVPRRINNVQTKADAILGDDVRNWVNVRRLPDGLVGLETTLGVDQVGRKDGVDESRLS